MNQQEATRAGTVSGLRARRTVKEIMSYGDFSKNTFCDDKWKFHECAAFGGSAYVFMTAR